MHSFINRNLNINQNARRLNGIFILCFQPIHKKSFQFLCDISYQSFDLTTEKYIILIVISNVCLIYCKLTL